MNHQVLPAAPTEHAADKFSSADSPPGCAHDAFAAAESLESAQAWSAHLARSHYENFPVISLLLPKSLRQDFCNIYAFCRIADDLGDEMQDTQASMFWLEKLRQQVLICYESPTSAQSHDAGQLATALMATIGRYDIPAQPFLDLISAFEQDQQISRYDDFPQLLDYCRRSADPVGRLVLYLCGYRDAQRQRLSDFTCSALQLINFWQDVRNDILQRDRIYIPRDSMEYFGVTEEQLRLGQCNQNYRDLIRFEVNRAEAMFDRGEELLPMLDHRHRGHVALFGQGGRTILQSIREQDYDTLSHRPVLSRRQKSRLIVRGLAAGVRRFL